MSEQLLRMSDVAKRYGISQKTIRRAIASRNGSIAPPVFDRPYRWREADVDRHIATSSVVDRRQQRAKRLRMAS